MSAALDHAVRSGRLRSNPARGLGLPRPARRDYVYLTHRQVLDLATVARPWRLLILVLAYTGLRWGRSYRPASVRHRLRPPQDRGPACVLRCWRPGRPRHPKSHQSRSVPVPRFIAAELAAAAKGQRADDLLFTMPGGSLMRLSNWRQATFLPACSRAGISARFRIHDLRHTAAALMVQAGYPPKMLQEIMGHASITTTLDLYGHLYPGEMDRYTDRLDEAAGDADAAKMRPDDDEDDPADEETAL
jgi:integrase